MVAESYDLITDSPTKEYMRAVKGYLREWVATYGKELARMWRNKDISER